MAMKPTAYWPANEGTGEIVHDAMPGANNGELHHVGWQHGFLNFKSAFQWLEIPSSPALRSGDFSAGGWVYLRGHLGGSWINLPGSTGMSFFSNTSNTGTPWMGTDKDGFGIFLRWTELIEVVSGGELDILETRKKLFGLSRGQFPALHTWHHLLLTYQAEGGVMRMFFNGFLLAEREGVTYKPSSRPFLVGSDADWWFQASTPGSLDGSVRELVFFDRALEDAEVLHLFRVSRPLVSPDLEVVGDAEALMEVIRSSETPEQQRATAVLQLTEMGVAAQAHAPTLADLLIAEVGSKPPHLPRIENFYRNALIRALLRLEARDETSRKALRQALVEPLVARLDADHPGLPGIRAALEANDPHEALRLYRELADSGPPLLSQGDKLRDARPRGPSENTRAYTPQAERDGVIFRVGTGVAWEGGEPVRKKEFRAAIERAKADFPEAGDWQPKIKDLFRVPITRIDPDGSTKTIYLEGPDFIMDGHDLKMRGWSIAIDTDGFLHLTGGMHNSPNPNYYIPGSWEKLGLSRKPNDPNFPVAMVWVSRKPMDIESFEFVGTRGNPLLPPAPTGLNYMNYVQDHDGNLFLYSRISVDGMQSWGLYRYSTEEKKWSAVGGSAADVMNDILAADPSWKRYLERPFRNVRVPGEDSPITVAYAWQPHFYNYCRDPRAVQFDLENRMHAWFRIFGIDGAGLQKLDRIYAFSDDGGRTFRRVDGSPVRLPLTVNSAPHHNAAAAPNQVEMWWNLWTSVFQPAGYFTD